MASNIGSHIMAERVGRGLTQQQLADVVGVTRASICRYESGKRTPKIDTLQKIAKALDVDWTELVSEEERSELLIEAAKPILNKLHEEAKNGTLTAEPSHMVPDRAWHFTRIHHNYERLNTDGRLAAGECFMLNLDDETIKEVAEYVAKLANTPEYRRIEPAGDSSNIESPKK
jgi:transcriptional regulator with XRE-family HTH domain